MQRILIISNPELKNDWVAAHSEGLHPSIRSFYSVYRLINYLLRANCEMQCKKISC